MAKRVATQHVPLTMVNDKQSFNYDILSHVNDDGHRQ